MNINKANVQSFDRSTRVLSAAGLISCELTKALQDGRTAVRVIWAALSLSFLVQLWCVEDVANPQRCQDPSA